MDILTVNISKMVRYRANITIATNIMSYVCFRLTYFELTLTYSKINLAVGYSCIDYE